MMKAVSDMVSYDPTPPATLAAVPAYHAALRPHAIALIFEERAMDFRTLEHRSNQVAHRLRAAGLKRGDRVAYVGKNSDSFFELLFGAAQVGVVLTGAGWRLAEAELAYILADADARLVFAGPEVADPLARICAQLPLRPPVIVLEGATAVVYPVYEAWRDRHEPDSLERPEQAACVEQDVAADDIVLQLYTSGTTGRPKGVLLSHRNMMQIWQEAEATLDWGKWNQDDVSLIATPVTHVGGSAWGLRSLINGVTGIILRDFDPATVLGTIARHGVSKLFVVPSMLQAMLNQPEVRTLDYSRIKCILYGASPIPLELLRECLTVFGCGFCQNYGMTETAGAIAYLPPQDHDPDGTPRMRCAGKPMPGVELRIQDAAGTVLPIGAIGEVATRSTGNMMGYWKLAQATAATLDGEGWLRTGDVGYLDEDGYLTIHDRLKDMIISGGENIYCSEVESAIYGHPHVADVAVIGVPDPKWGEAVKAIVVPKPGVEPDAADIIAYARARIAAFKAPKSVDFIEAMPRNPSGKIVRRELREPYWADLARQVN